MKNRKENKIKNPVFLKKIREKIKINFFLLPFKNYLKKKTSQVGLEPTTLKLGL